MKQQEKDLLFCDLSARLPYRLKYCTNIDIDGMRFSTMTIDSIKLVLSGEYKPYLRPMSSMTTKEKEEYDSCRKHLCDEYNRYCFDSVESIDWLNAHHFDYRGLIDKGIALEAPEGMYNQQN